jgi:hypothetical protein
MWRSRLIIGEDEGGVAETKGNLRPGLDPAPRDRPGIWLLTGVELYLAATSGCGWSDTDKTRCKHAAVWTVQILRWPVQWDPDRRASLPAGAEPSRVVDQSRRRPLRLVTSAVSSPSLNPWASMDLMA